MDLSLPPANLRFMNETDEAFTSIGESNIELLEGAGLNNSTHLLDIGSGYGRLAIALNIRHPNFDGRYVGVDILPKHINWCQDNIQNKMSNYAFDTINVQNDRYLAEGQKSATKYQFEFADSSFDQVGLFSVFTHMYEAEIANYLSEISRVLKPGGTCVATFFVFDDERLARINARDAGITLKHKLSDNNYYFNEKDPLHAIAFRETHVSDMASAAGLEFVGCEWGHWAGGNSKHYQDPVTLKKAR